MDNVAVKIDSQYCLVKEKRASSQLIGEEIDDSDNESGDKAQCDIVSINKLDLFYENTKCCMIVIKDLSELYTLETEQQKNKNLKQSVSCMSHELKSSLKFISHFCDNMLHDCNENQRMFVRNIKWAS